MQRRQFLDNCVDALTGGTIGTLLGTTLATSGCSLGCSLHVDSQPTAEVKNPPDIAVPTECLEAPQRYFESSRLVRDYDALFVQYELQTSFLSVNQDRPVDPVSLALCSPGPVCSPQLLLTFPSVVMEDYVLRTSLHLLDTMRRQLEAFRGIADHTRAEVPWRCCYRNGYVPRFVLVPIRFQCGYKHPLNYMLYCFGYLV